MVKKILIQDVSGNILVDTDGNGAVANPALREYENDHAIPNLIKQLGMPARQTLGGGNELLVYTVANLNGAKIAVQDVAANLEQKGNLNDLPPATQTAIKLVRNMLRNREIALTQASTKIKNLKRSISEQPYKIKTLKQNLQDFTKERGQNSKKLKRVNNEIERAQKELARLQKKGIPENASHIERITTQKEALQQEEKVLRLQEKKLKQLRLQQIKKEIEQMKLTIHNNLIQTLEAEIAHLRQDPTKSVTVLSTTIKQQEQTVEEVNSKLAKLKHQTEKHIRGQEMQQQRKFNPLDVGNSINKAFADAQRKVGNNPLSNEQMRDAYVEGTMDVLALSEEQKDQMSAELKGTWKGSIARTIFNAAKLGAFALGAVTLYQVGLSALSAQENAWSVDDFSKDFINLASSCLVSASVVQLGSKVISKSYGVATGLASGLILGAPKLAIRLGKKCLGYKDQLSGQEVLAMLEKELDQKMDKKIYEKFLEQYNWKKVKRTWDGIKTVPGYTGEALYYLVGTTVACAVAKISLANGLDQLTQNVNLIGSTLQTLFIKTAGTSLAGHTPDWNTLNNITPQAVQDLAKPLIDQVKNLDMATLTNMTPDIIKNSATDLTNFIKTVDIQAMTPGFLKNLGTQIQTFANTIATEAMKPEGRNLRIAAGVIIGLALAYKTYKVVKSFREKESKRRIRAQLKDRDLEI